MTTSDNPAAEVAQAVRSFVTRINTERAAGIIFSGFFPRGLSELNLPFLLVGRQKAIDLFDLFNSQKNRLSSSHPRRGVQVGVMRPAVQCREPDSQNRLR